MINTEKKNRKIIMIAIPLVVIAAIVINIRYLRIGMVSYEEKFVQEHTPVLNYHIQEQYTEQEAAAAILDIFTLYHENREQIKFDFYSYYGPENDFLKNHKRKRETLRNYFSEAKDQLDIDNLYFCRDLLDQILDKLPEDTVFTKNQIHEDLEDENGMYIIIRCKNYLEQNNDFDFFMDVDDASNSNQTLYKAYDILYHDRLEAEAVRMLNDEKYCYKHYYMLMYYFEGIGKTEIYQERLDAVREVVEAKEAEEEAAFLKKQQEQLWQRAALLKKEDERKKRIESSRKQEQNRVIDPEDCDIEAYYEDNKDLFDNYDDAYDDFMDNPGEWVYYR